MDDYGFSSSQQSGIGDRYLTRLAPQQPQSSGADFVNTISALLGAPSAIGNAWRHRNDEQKFIEFARANPNVLYDPLGSSIPAEMHGNPHLLRHINNFIAARTATAGLEQSRAQTGHMQEQTRGLEQQRGERTALNDPRQQGLARDVVNQGGRFPEGGPLPANAGFWSMIGTGTPSQLQENTSRDKHSTTLSNIAQGEQDYKQKHDEEQMKLERLKLFTNSPQGFGLSTEQMAEMTGQTIPLSAEQQRKQAMAKAIADGTAGPAKQARPGAVQKAMNLFSGPRFSPAGGPTPNPQAQATPQQFNFQVPGSQLEAPQNPQWERSVPGILDLEQVLQMLRQLQQPQLNMGNQGLIR